MNELTKEELRFIWGRLCLLNSDQLGQNINLPNKIYTMINNYCEHEWRRSAINAIYCPNCQKQVEHSE